MQNTSKLCELLSFIAPRTPLGSRPRFLRKLIAICLTLFGGTALYGQSESENPYLGGVPTGTASPTALSLSLEDAVGRGLRQNLGGLLSADAESGARGERWRALSSLLPNLTTATSFGVRQNDLKAIIGITVPGHPPVIGPFGVFDTRAYLNQSIFNWESIERARSSTAQEKSALFSYQNARELIVAVVVSNYLLVIAEQSQVESALAQRDTAKVLLEQTTDQKTAGLAAKVDVLRSDVELQTREQRLIVARNNLAKQKLVLARAIGLPAGQTFDIATEVAYQPLTTSTLEEALCQAYTSRPDYKSQIEQVRSAELQKKAASAERYPTLSAVADYGSIGTNFAANHGTVDAAAELRLPIFPGGKVHGDNLVADSVVAGAKQRLEDLRAGIDQEVRDAFLDLQDTSQEVSVEKNAVRLATETLEQSRDRFASGVTDNIEVVQAQESLADANDAYISGLYRYNTAKISLARAIGGAESNYALYLRGK
ncbi:MAG TPA: TolC family protein [Candidatus Eremiobacteraceae bacterium]|nr:TolC family protein [Candidatus Eremiobacteraceae bacterium]